MQQPGQQDSPWAAAPTEASLSPGFALLLLTTGQESLRFPWKHGEGVRRWPFLPSGDSYLSSSIFCVRTRSFVKNRQTKEVGLSYRWATEGRDILMIFMACCHLSSCRPAALHTKEERNHLEQKERFVETGHLQRQPPKRHVGAGYGQLVRFFLPCWGFPSAKYWFGTRKEISWFFFVFAYIKSSLARHPVTPVSLKATATFSC